MARLSETRLEVSTMFNLSKVRYSVSQAKKNLIRNGLMSIASLFTITCCLLILGLFTVISINVNSYTEQMKDQCEVQLYMTNGITDERITQIGEEIVAVSNVKAFELYTREELYNYAMNDVFKGREELIGEYTEEDNPFSDSYKITLADISLTEQTVSELSKIADVDHIENKQDMTNIVLTVSNVVKKVSIVIMIILLLVSMVIISNTVRLTVFNRRKEINIMKYIGATDAFIRIPFVIEGVMIGIIGALLSFGMISWGYIALSKMYLNSGFDVVELVSYTQLAPFIGILFVLFGCLIGVIGSAISMNKYLKV